MRSRLIEYANMLHERGVGSKAATDFRERWPDDRLFVERADIIDRLFLNRFDLLAVQSGSRDGPRTTSLTKTVQKA